MFQYGRILLAVLPAICACGNTMTAPAATLEDLDAPPVCNALPPEAVEHSTDGLIPPDADPNELTNRERSEGWRLLFDGTGLANWTGFERGTTPSAWVVRDGALTLTDFPGDVPDRSRGDIRTVQAFEDFELRLQWALEPGGNSGIFFHVREGVADRIWESAPELQIADDARAAEQPTHLSGSLFDIHAPLCDATKPVGEYNDTRLVVRDGHAEHWFNGYRVVAYELGSAKFDARVADSKFRGMREFAAARRGYLALQDHGTAIRFRSIRIREL